MACFFHHLSPPTHPLHNLPIESPQKDLPDLVQHKHGHRIFLQLLTPYSSKYFCPTSLGIMNPPEKIGAIIRSKNGADEVGAGSGSDGEEAGVAAPGPLGRSKKDQALRRKELLEGGLGMTLLTAVTEATPELLRQQHGADVVMEACRGGEGGVLEAAVGAAAIDTLHDAVAAVAAAAPAEGEEPLLSSYFGSRALRRLALASAEPGAAGEAAARCVEKVWKAALKGRCAELAGSHAAKVLAAVLECGSSVAKGEAKKELAKAMPGGKLKTWAAQFSQHHQGKKA
jgi:hypothetical protein